MVLRFDDFPAAFDNWGKQRLFLRTVNFQSLPWLITAVLRFEKVRENLPDGSRFVVIAPDISALSKILDWSRVRLPLKSKYVFGKSDLLQEVTQPSCGSAMSLEPLVGTSIGFVYLNLDSQCDR